MKTDTAKSVQLRSFFWSIFFSSFSSYCLYKSVYSHQTRENKDKKKALFTQFYDKYYVNNLIHLNKGKDFEWIKFESISLVRLLWDSWI